MKRPGLTYERRKALTGFLFTLPFVIGAITFFLRPFINTLLYSFSTLEFQENSVKMSMAGFQNYIDAFVGNSEFLPAFLNALTDMLYEVPFILVFSLGIAVVLSSDFHGRTFFRAAFFLPVIISSGQVAAAVEGSATAALSGDQSVMMFQALSMEPMLISLGMSEGLISTIMGVVNNIFELTWKSGVQILVFIAGLKGIPGYLYEVTELEGANKWETFWLVTFRMISPMIIVNVVYTVVDSFSDAGNPVMKHISKLTQNLDIELGSAMASIYFITVFIIVAFVFWLLSRKTFSYSE